MQKYGVFIGIDISKHWFDASLYWAGLSIKQPHRQFKNNHQGFLGLLKWIARQVQAHGLNGGWYFCIEQTGTYALGLACFLEQAHQQVVLESPLRIKRCSGLRRGKTDPADARAIARYAEGFHQQIVVRPLLSQVLLQVQTLLSLRARLVRYSGGLHIAAQELQGFVPLAVSQPVAQYTEPVFQLMQKQSKEVEKRIEELLFSHAELRRLYGLIQSVKGIGPIITAYLLVYTNGFTAFQKARQFACYIGVAPFKHRSGCSIQQPDRVSYLANQRLKALLSNAASVAIRWDPQLKAFAKKHRDKDKNQGWILNAVKNKIVHRVFAVVKRGTPYVVLEQN